jgi:hypothetical protein
MAAQIVTLPKLTVRTVAASLWDIRGNRGASSGRARRIGAGHAACAGGKGHGLQNRRLPDVSKGRDDARDRPRSCLITDL